MKTATAVPNAVSVKHVHDYDGIGFLYVDIGPDHYRDFKKLPAALEYAGRVFGKSCFDSDRNVAIFRTDVKVARKAAK